MEESVAEKSDTNMAPEQSTPEKQRFVSLRLKILVAFTVLFTVIFVGTYYWFYLYSTARATERIREDLISTLEATAAHIDGGEILALYQEGEPRSDGFTNDPRYWDNIRWMDTVHEIEPRAWPGTYVRDGDSLYFVTDLYAIYDPASATKFQEWCDPDPEVCGVPDTPFEEWSSIVALTEERTVIHPTIYTDQWGTWFSAYAPLKNDQGETVAGLFLDFQGDYVTQVQQGIRDRVLLAFIITYAFFFAFIFIISTLGTRPIIRLTRAAEAVGEGDYEQDFTKHMRSRFPDEIHTLARVFQIMIGKVAQREQTLRQRVEELRIEIDDVKRQSEVKKIVESDAFRELKLKAREMRARRQAGTSSAESSITEPSE